MSSGPVNGSEWRVSWTMWTPGDAQPYRHEVVRQDEHTAREQYEGLMMMLAPHEPRICRDHVWDVKLERRLITVGPWKEEITE